MLISDCSQNIISHSDCPSCPSKLFKIILLQLSMQQWYAAITISFNFLAGNWMKCLAFHDFNPQHKAKFKLLKTCNCLALLYILSPSAAAKSMYCQTTWAFIDTQHALSRVKLGSLAKGKGILSKSHESARSCQCFTSGNSIIMPLYSIVPSAFHAKSSTRINKWPFWAERHQDLWIIFVLLSVSEPDVS